MMLTHGSALHYRNKLHFKIYIKKKEKCILTCNNILLNKCSLTLIQERLSSYMSECVLCDGYCVIKLHFVPFKQSGHSIIQLKTIMSF